MIAVAPASEKTGTVLLASDPKLTFANYKTYLGIPSSATASMFSGPYWYFSNQMAPAPPTAVPNFAFAHQGRRACCDRRLGHAPEFRWLLVFPARVDHHYGPRRVCGRWHSGGVAQAGSQRLRLPDNLTPAALEQVQRGAFSPTNGVEGTAYNSPTTGAVPSYLTGANPCQGSTPIRKVWNPQFSQSTESNNDTLRGVLGVRGRFGGDWKWETYYQYGQTKSMSYQNNAVTQYRLNWAMDAVVDDRVARLLTVPPVCRVVRDGVPTLDTSGQPVSDPASLQALASGCKPINVFGTSYGTTGSMPATPRPTTRVSCSNRRSPIHSWTIVRLARPPSMISPSPLRARCGRVSARAR